MKCTHTIHAHNCHHGWNNANAPALRIAPGETIEFQTVDSSGGQLSAASTLADLGRLDFAKVNPVTGPVSIDGAEPGDAIKVTLLEFGPSGWGWTANIPGFGLLADDFKDPALHIWKYDAATLAPALYGPGGKVPLKPFCGTIGLAPAEAGQHSVVPPRRMGGNMDIRDMAAGTELYLPVEVAGGLFSVGDTHACQGDGEVCGTAVEYPSTTTIQVDVIKGWALEWPRLENEHRIMCIGSARPLEDAARIAYKDLVLWMEAEYGFDRWDAYMMLSQCGVVRLGNFVDPKYTVGAGIEKKYLAP